MLRATSCLVLAIAAVTVAGCGSGAGAGASSDPASVVPQGALLYAEATVRPQDGARDGALAAAGKILHTTHPAARLRQLVSDALVESEGGSGRVDYARDVEPWLGDTAAVWLDAPPRAGTDPSGAAAIAVRDEDAARSEIESLVRRSGDRLTQKGDLEVTSSGDALTVRDGWAYFGQEAAVRHALSADSHLADSDSYRKAVEDLPDHRLATYYMDTPRLFDAIGSDPQFAATRSFFTQDARPVALAFTADGDRLAFETVGTSGSPFGTLAGGEAPELLRELPGDSWAAFGAAKAGDTLRTTFQATAGVLGGAAFESRLRQEFGIDIEQDLFSWMGDAAVFVRGTSKDTLDGGLVVQVTDESRATQAFGKIVGLVRTRGGLDAQPVRVPGADAAFDLGAPDTPKPLIFARGQGRVVLALGRGAAAAGLAPSQQLGDSALYRDGKEALGGYEPALLLSVPQIVSVLLPASDVEQAKPYIDAFTVLAAGAERDGDKLRSRLVAGLRP